MHVLGFLLDVWTIISGANQLPANLLQLNALVNNAWIAVEHESSVRTYMLSFTCAVNKRLSLAKQHCSAAFQHAELRGDMITCPSVKSFAVWLKLKKFISLRQDEK